MPRERDRTTLGIALLVAVAAVIGKAYPLISIPLTALAIFFIAWGRDQRRVEAFVGRLVAGSYLLKCLHQLDLIISPRDDKSKQQKNEFINQIALLLNEGDSIRQTFLDIGDTELIKQQYIMWSERTYAYLSKNLGNSYAVQFKNAHGNAGTGMPSGRSIEGGGYWQEIQGKNLALNDFIGELRRD